MTNHNRLKKLEEAFGARRRCPACGWREGEPTTPGRLHLERATDAELDELDRILSAIAERQPAEGQSR